MSTPRTSVFPFVIVAILAALAFTVWPTLYRSNGIDAAGNPLRLHRFTGAEEVKVPGAEGWVNATKSRNLLKPDNPDPLNLVDKFNARVDADQPGKKSQTDAVP